MKRLFSILAIGFLVFAGVRAPEESEHLRGYCWSGPVLEKAADSAQNGYEFKRVSDNPLLSQAGFAPSANPFDLPPVHDLFMSLPVDLSLFASGVSPVKEILPLPDKPPRFSLV